MELREGMYRLGEIYSSFSAKLIKAIMNTDVNTGGMSKPDLVNAYHVNQGVSVEFVGTIIRTTFGWKSVLDLKDGILFFGPPLDSSRNYNLLFRKGRDSNCWLQRLSGQDTHPQVRWGEEIDV